MSVIIMRAIMRAAIMIRLLCVSNIPPLPGRGAFWVVIVCDCAWVGLITIITLATSVIPLSGDHGIGLVAAVPAMVKEYCPGGTDDVVETVRTELKLGVPDVGFSDVEISFGTPDTDKATF